MLGSEGGGRKRAVSRYHLEILQAGLRVSGTSSAPYPTKEAIYLGTHKHYSVVSVHQEVCLGASSLALRSYVLPRERLYYSILTAMLNSMK